MLREITRRHAAASPDRCAVVAAGRRITYREVDTAAAALSAALSRRGIGPGRLVALHMPRTVDAVVAILGVLGTGAAYTVIEDDGNRTENEARISAAHADLVLTPATLRGDAAAPPAPAACAGAPAAGLEGAAYVLYTSGSTGVPKGVVVTHRNVCHYVTALLSRLGIAEPLSYAVVSTLSADLANTCVFLPLWTGGTVHLIGDDMRKDPSALLAYLRRERIDVLKITPSHWGTVFRAFRPGPETGPALRFLILGGEALRRGLAGDILRSGVTRTLVNHYGPTEATVGVAVHTLSSAAEIDAIETESVPIGTPLGRTRFIVRTADGVYLDRGMGELLIGGPSVAAGYRDDPAATQAAFVTGVAVRGDDACARFYRTGDLVDIGADGTAVFLGRTDRQVKINGHRVELEHVESVARRACAGANAVALYLPIRSRHRLVLAVASCSEDQAALLPARLSETLPSYMVPAQVIRYDGDFPRNANGKTDHGAIRRFAESVAGRQEGDPDTSAAHQGNGDPLAAEVRQAWQSCLQHRRFGDHTDFFASGGSSLDAIQVVADLQSAGHPITAKTFLAAPTIAATCRAIKQARTGAGPGLSVAPAPGIGQAAPGERALTFSAAQAHFFRRDHPQPDHYNQALLLEAAATVDPAAIAAAAADLTRLHPLLSTAYRRRAGGWTAEIVTPDPGVFSSSCPGAGAGVPRDDLARHVRLTAARLHATVDLARGAVFKVHLFSVPGGADLVLLICHHLCVDAVSWRILISDLIRGYRARLAGGAPGLAPSPTTFWDWTEHIARRARDFSKEFDEWWNGTDVPLLPALPPAPEGHQAVTDGGNLERDASTAWLAFSDAETRLLYHEFAARTGVPLHAALLGAFVHAIASAQGTGGAIVDAESHGRTAIGADVDVSRVVGWFTSTFPVRVAAVAGDAVATIRATAAALSAVPNLGIGHGLRDEPPDPGMTAPICYNFVGPFRFEYDEVLSLTPSQLPIGPARGDLNDRGHELKLTARIVRDHLVIDLSFNGQRHDPALITAVLLETHTHLLRMAGTDPTTADVLVERGSASGLLGHVPAELPLGSPRRGVRGYRSVLLTGATGFIGAHLLHLLLTRTSASVYCLVRGTDRGQAARRLSTAYRWYFPDQDLERYASRLAVYSGDVTHAGLGVPGDVYRSLCDELDAIYHLAGNTRLIGDQHEFERDNVESVRAVLRLARNGKPKDLHYLSTLAIAGTNRLRGPVRFTECDLNIGQEFRNPYERSKYLGEKLVNEFISLGGAGFIYRAGNVSGHSVTGRFQRNARQNRLIQELRAVMATGRLPRQAMDRIALSPVDTVAEAVLKISLNAKIPCGTFHVDTSHEVAYADVLAEIERLGHPFETSDADDIAGVLATYGDQADPVIALGSLWASRSSHNVRFDHSRTHAVLADLGVVFEPLGKNWLRAFVRRLAEEGHLVPGHRHSVSP